MDNNTILSQGQTRAYNIWAKGQGKNTKLEEQDYDLRGLFKDSGPVNFKAGQHGTDKYKKPNHPTFSNESQYSNTKTPGGQWSQNLDNRSGQPTNWKFKASSQNKRVWSKKALQQYFKRVEPGNELDY